MKRHELQAVEYNVLNMLIKFLPWEYNCYCENILIGLFWRAVVYVLIKGTNYQHENWYPGNKIGTVGIYQSIYLGEQWYMCCEKARIISVKIGTMGIKLAPWEYNCYSGNILKYLFRRAVVYVLIKDTNYQRENWYHWNKIGTVGIYQSIYLGEQWYMCCEKARTIGKTAELL